jgi:hypothetical protein
MKTDVKEHHELCEYELCSTGYLEHPRFFPRQIVTDGDLTLEHQYVRDSLRRHNLYLHGWGVVCGAKVCLTPTCDGLAVEPWKVAIEPGYILGPYGDEIVIDRPQIVDLRRRGYIKTTGEVCGEAKDPWCSDVYVNSPPTRIYVAVRYKEVLCRPVRIQPIGCGCDDMPCEYSRIRDGYEVGFLCDCPEPQKARNGNHTNGDHGTNEDHCGKLAIPECPCPTDPWVVLAEVHLDECGIITKIDNCSCRRLVKSLAAEVLHCKGCPEVERTLDPDKQIYEPNDEVTVSLKGTIPEPLHIRSGSGISVQSLQRLENESGWQFTLKISSDARSGPRRITVQYPDCCFTTFDITICETDRAQKR